MGTMAHGRHSFRVRQINRSSRYSIRSFIGSEYKSLIADEGNFEISQTSSLMIARDAGKLRCRNDVYGPVDRFDIETR